MKATYAMPRKAKAPSGERVPRVARLLALAHKFQGMLDRGEVKSMAELARVGRVSRARITQVMDLLMLAPEIQEQILFLRAAASGLDAITLGEIRAVCAEAEWGEQGAGWKALVYPRAS